MLCAGRGLGLSDSPPCGLSVPTYLLSGHLTYLPADLILTYYATEAAKWMAADKPSWR